MMKTASVKAKAPHAQPSDAIIVFWVIKWQQEAQQTQLTTCFGKSVFSALKKANSQVLASE